MTGVEGRGSVSQLSKKGALSEARGHPLNRIRVCSALLISALALGRRARRAPDYTSRPLPAMGRLQKIDISKVVSERLAAVRQLPPSAQDGKAVAPVGSAQESVSDTVAAAAFGMRALFGSCRVRVARRECLPFAPLMR